jgi:hypothetical protein
MCVNSVENSLTSTVGPVTVSCEGYTSPNDPYVLRGSCGLEYTLEYTPRGQQNSYSSGSQSSYTYPERTFNEPVRLPKQTPMKALLGLDPS